MTSSSILNPDILVSDHEARKLPKGHDIRSLGPSDSSDSGSDLVGANLNGMDDNSDRYGTGESATVGNERDVRINADLDVDRIVSAAEAGLGGGLDQAEEAQLGITDEELTDEELDEKVRELEGLLERPVQ